MKRSKIALGCTIALLSATACGTNNGNNMETNNLFTNVSETTDAVQETSETTVSVADTRETVETKETSTTEPNRNLVSLTKEFTADAKKCLTDNNISEDDYIGCFEVDLDLDGANESFVVVTNGTDYCSALYYVSDDTVEQVYQSYYATAEEAENSHGYYVTQDDRAFFIYDCECSVTEMEGTLFTVENGKLTTCYPEGVTERDYKYFNENKDLIVQKSFYGSIVMLDTPEQTVSSGDFSGHCYICYPFAFDPVQKKYVEYPAQIRNDWEDVSVNYSMDYEAGTKGTSRSLMIERDNGELDIVNAIPSAYGYDFRTDVYQKNDSTETWDFIETYEGYMNTSYAEDDLSKLVNYPYELEVESELADFDDIKKFVSHTNNLAGIHFMMEDADNQDISSLSNEVKLSILSDYLFSSGEEYSYDEETGLYTFDDNVIQKSYESLFGTPKDTKEDTSSRYYQIDKDGKYFFFYGEWGTISPSSAIKEITCLDEAQGIYELRICYYTSNWENQSKYQLGKYDVEGKITLKKDVNAAFGYDLTDFKLYAIK